MSDSYPDFVDRLKKPGRDILASLDANDCDLLHMSIGILGEAAELIKEIRNCPDPIPIGGSGHKLVLKELGDLKFFLTGIGLEVNKGVSANCVVYPNQGYVLGLALDLLGHAEVVSDLVKKFVIGEQAPQVIEMLGACRKVDALVDEIGGCLGKGPREVVEMNMDKLSERFYEGKWTNKANEERRGGH